MDKGSRVGRPPLPPAEVKRHPVGICTTAQLKAQLESSAAASGRSVASEIEHRLERSIVIDALLSPELQRVALLVATTFIADPERPGQPPEDPNQYDNAVVRVFRLLWRDHPDRSLDRLERVLRRLVADREHP